MNSWPYWSDTRSSAKSNHQQETNSRPPPSSWWYGNPAGPSSLPQPPYYPAAAGYSAAGLSADRSVGHSAGRAVSGHTHQDARYQPYQRPYYDHQAGVAGLQQQTWYHHHPHHLPATRVPPCPPAYTQHQPPFQPQYQEWPPCHDPYPLVPPPRYDHAFSQPQQLSTVDGVQSGVPTLTTPTLTPTTLRNIQQTFLQASVNVHTQPPESHSNQAGFVPPVVHPQPGSTFISIDSKSLGGGIATVVDTSIRGTESSSKELTSGGPPPLLPISGIISSSTSSFSSTAGPMPSVAALNVSSSNSNSSSSSSDSGNEHTTTTTTAANRRMGGRRPNNTAKLSEEEEKKRLIRRERNKMAAARCRKRRLDQTMTLQEETDRLEEKKSSLQHEISVLQQQREELEFLLETHKAVCTRASRLSTAQPSITTSVRDVAGPRDVLSTRDMASARPLPVVTTACSGPLTNSSAAQLDSAPDICVKEEALSDGEELYTNSLFSSIIPRNRALEPVTSVAVCTSKTSSSAGASKPHRPTSLAVAPLTELGVSIETPSAGLRGFNFDSMMDGGTGLTPVTPLTVGSMATGLTPLTTPIMPHPSASVASTTVSSASKSSTLCSHQQRSNSSELSSPDSLTPKHLVSL